MDWFVSWVKSHPAAYPLILAILGGLISVFSLNIKRAITHWPRSAASTWSKTRKLNRLHLMKSIHNNTYALLIHLVIEGISLVWAALLWTTVFSIYAAIARQPVY